MAPECRRVVTVSCGACSSAGDLVAQQIITAAAVVFHCAGKPFFCELEIETYVKEPAGFPLQVGVGRIEDGAGFGAILVEHRE